MLGLFMLLPVLSLYADSLSGATPLTIGVAIGSYGLMQAFLQIPFAMLSDYIGRRNVLLIGLALFIAGSAVAYLAEDILVLIIGRMLQGAGAIAGVLLAVLSDQVSDERRVRANAVIGMVIGMAFVLALVCAPVFDSIWGLKGIFAFNGVSAVLALLAVFFLLAPDRVRHRSHIATVPSAQLIDLCVGIFLLHAMLTACFLVVPRLLLDVAGLEVQSHWSAYLAALSLAALLAWPVLRTRGQLSSKAVYGASMLLLLSGFILANASMLITMLLGLGIFFAGFGMLESLFPALLARRLQSHERGVGNGFYSTFQFTGSFAGGLAGGALLSTWDAAALLYCVAPLMLLWALAFRACVDTR
jgi:MFS family permease